MIIHRLVLSDGTVVGHGGQRDENIRKCTVTQCVNSDRELMPGSVCCASLEATVQLTGKVRAGEQVTLFTVVPGSEPVQVGVFTLEKPTRMGRQLYKLVAYDDVSRLDKDVSEWLGALTGWPYRLSDFAGMVCEACGVELVEGEIPNGSFPVQKFYQAGVTGRQILRWVGEMACRFLYADPEGKLRFGWYEDRGGQITPTGDGYYFAGALSYEDYEVAAVDAVKVRLSGTDGGLLWPEGAAENPYVVSGNPITLAKVDDSLPSYLEVVRQELAALPVYRPCKVSVPADRDIRVGDVVTVEDSYGAQFQTLVMTRTVTGQKQTLECTGSMVRGSSTAANNKTPGQIAQEAVDRQSQRDIFNKLTDRGKAQGLFLGEDGNVYLNVTYATAGVLQSVDGKTFYLDLDNGILKMQATELSINGQSVEDIAGDAADGLTQQEIFDKLTGGQKDQGIYLSGTDLYLNASCMKTGTLDAGTVDVQNLSASKIKTGTLDASKVTVSNLSAGAITAGVLKSTDGMTSFDLSGGSIVTKADGGYYVSIGAGAVALKDSGGKTRVLISQSSSTYCVYLTTEDGKICGFSVDGDDFYLVAPNGDGTGTIGHRPCWKTIDGNVVLTTC